MFNGEFKNAAETGKFVNACIDLYKNLGNKSFISKKSVELFDRAFEFFSGKKSDTSNIQISEDELRSIFIKVFNQNTPKFMKRGQNNVCELHNPMKRELAIHHKKDLRELLQGLSEEQKTDDLIAFRKLLA